MSYKKELYFKAEEIIIDTVKDYDNHVHESHQRIVNHQLAGLRSMGCNIEIMDSMVEVTHPNKPGQPFYNRLIDICMDESKFNRVVQNLPCGSSIEVTPFSRPTNCENILNNNGVKHTLSTVVLAKELQASPILPSLSFDIVKINDQNLADYGLNLFSSFFIKPGETMSEVATRYRDNLSRGPHFVVFDNKKPIATIGAIVVGDTASVYNGIVLPEYRNNGLITHRMCLELEKSLYEGGVNFYYYKTRNRAVATLAPRYLGLKLLYNERIYENK